MVYEIFNLLYSGNGKMMICCRNDEYQKALISIFEKPALIRIIWLFCQWKDYLANLIHEAKMMYIEVLNPDFLRNAISLDEIERL